MIRIVVLIFSFFLLLSCSEEKRARIRASKADSIMYAAGDMRDYARILALADSLEALGDLTEVNANRWRGVAYFHQGHHRTSEFYYKKAVAADIKSENDALNYNKSARRLANMMLKKGDYEGALRVAMDALDKMHENNSGSETDVAILTNSVGCCLLNLGRTEQAAKNFEEAYGLSASVAKETVRKLFDNGDYDPGRTEAFIRSMCKRRAEMINQTTYEELLEALDADESDEALKATPEGVFENAEENRADSAGLAFAGALIGWSSIEACRQNGARGQNVFKTWETTSGNPRASHARMNGETVQYDQPFSNGAMWPGDIDNLDVEDVANCHCILVIEVRD